MTEPVEQPPAATGAPTTMQWLRTAAHRISRGSSRLAWLLARRITRRGVAHGRRMWRGATAWLAAASGLDWLLRAAILAGAVLLARHTVPHLGHTLARHAGQASGLMGPAVLVWLIAAYRIGRDDWEPPADKQPVETAPATDGQSAPGKPPVQPAALVAAVRTVGTPHAHLVPLAEHLATTTDAVRTAAAEMGWPVKDVRMQGRSSTAGLRWDDCPSPTLAAPLRMLSVQVSAPTTTTTTRAGRGPERGCV